jgi:hypothetical protein
VRLLRSSLKTLGTLVGTLFSIGGTLLSRSSVVRFCENVV